MEVKYAKKFLPLRRENLPPIVPDIPKLSKQAKIRLKWIDYYNSHDKNAFLTARYFGISRKTFYKWLNRYKTSGLRGLEDLSRGPHRKRQGEITWEQELRIKSLRKKYIRYGKEKLAVIYEKMYGDKISSWKIYRVIRKYNLYFNPVKNEKLRKKRKLAEKKKRITELKKKEIKDLFFQMDTKVIWCYPTKRYIFTAIEKNTKIGFARMYKNNSSYSGRDFLLRLYFLLNNSLFYVHTDNGSEFAKYFQDACCKLGIPHYFSRPRTPKDHPEIERFNKTIEDEFLQMGNYIDDVETFNRLLTDWLIEYNFTRPHQSLGYITPMEVLYQKQEAKVLPKYPTCTLFTRRCVPCRNLWRPCNEDNRPDLKSKGKIFNIHQEDTHA